MPQLLILEKHIIALDIIFLVHLAMDHSDSLLSKQPRYYHFVEDETLEPGKQIITGIIKPQINYNGTMIQAAQITVSQNI